MLPGDGRRQELDVAVRGSRVAPDRRLDAIARRRPEDPDLGLPIALVDHESSRERVQDAGGRLPGVNDVAVRPRGRRGSFGDGGRGRGARGHVDDDRLLQQDHEHDDERREENEDADAEKEHDAPGQAGDSRRGRGGEPRRGRSDLRRRLRGHGGRGRGRERGGRDGSGRRSGRFTRRGQRRQRGKRGDRRLRAGLEGRQDRGKRRRKEDQLPEVAAVSHRLSPRFACRALFRRG